MLPPHALSPFKLMLSSSPTNPTVSIFTLAVAVLSLSLFGPEALGEDCPKSCLCKWKNGKETVECIDAHLFRLPFGLDPGTQVLDLSGNNLKVLEREAF